MKKVRITFLKGKKKSLRTKYVDGVATPWPPELGRPVHLEGEGLSDPSLVRVVDTTPVHGYVMDAETGVFTVTTKNSVYEMEEIE